MTTFQFVSPDEISPGSQHVQFASDMGFPVGFVPGKIVYGDTTFNLKSKCRDADGDVMYWIYQSAHYAELKVFND